MKDLAIGVIVFFIGLFTYTKLAGPIPFFINSVTTTKTDSFTVTGEGKVTVSPDIATINAGVQAQGGTVKVVQTQLDTNMKKISDAVKKLGVAAKDIQTSNYSIYPTYDYRSGSQRITGYQAGSTVTIKVRDLDRANSVIDAVTANGANQVDGISFDVDDKTKVENEARARAVADAKRKAEMAAKTAGFGLGRVINYSENTGGGVPRPFLYGKEAAMMGADAASAVPTANVEPGSTEVIVNVNMSYEIR